MKEVGPLFSEILRHKAIDQKDLAEAIGISPQQIGQILKKGADRWKLSYFDKACKFLKVHPKSFFDNWHECSNVVNGNIENSSVHGDSNFSMISNDTECLGFKDLRSRLDDKESQITALKEIIRLQRALLKQYGCKIEQENTDAP